MPSPPYERSVFLNVPFDRRYQPLLRGLVFAVFDCGFVPRSALERDDSAEVRLDKIVALIRRSKYAIHDISRTSLDSRHRLPRFNMPLELGMFLGAIRFGSGEQKRKRGLILDVDRYRYQKYCSDIAGQDVRAHGGSVRRVIGAARDWLGSTPESERQIIPSGRHIAERFDRFRRQMPAQCRALKLAPSELTFPDVCALAVGWQLANPR